MKIHHALKETSYLTDTFILTDSRRIATSIGNYLSVTTDETRAKALPHQNEFASSIYNCPGGKHDGLRCGEYYIPQTVNPVAENQHHGRKISEVESEEVLADAGHCRQGKVIPTQRLFSAVKIN